MNQFSVSDFKEDLKTFLLDKGYDAEIENNLLKIIEKESQEHIDIDLPIEIDEELSKISWCAPYLISGEGLISFVLIDEKEQFHDSKIEITGEIKGSFIKENIEEYGILYSNLRYLIDFEKLKILIHENQTTSLSSILNEHIVIVDLEINEEHKYYNSEKENELESVIDSSLFSLKNQTGILLYNPRNKYINSFIEQEPKEKIELKIINHIEPIKYFLSAEELSFPHLKYLEYYHVLEYYFMFTSIKEFDQKISDLVSLRLSGKNFQNQDYYKYMQNAYKHFTSKETVKEESQIKDLFVKDIGYTSIAIYINDNLSNLKDELNEDRKKKNNIFLQNSIYEIEETIISSYKDCCEDSGNQSNGKLLTTVTEEKAKILCEALARRVYKIRNFIVHTKKGERSNVFTPINHNFKLLENDLNLLKYLASFLLLKMADE